MEEDSVHYERDNDITQAHAPMLALLERMGLVFKHYIKTRRQDAAYGNRVIFSLPNAPANTGIGITEKGAWLHVSNAGVKMRERVETEEQLAEFLKDTTTADAYFKYKLTLLRDTLNS